jgi:hypothetical protein
MPSSSIDCPGTAGGNSEDFCDPGKDHELSSLDQVSKQRWCFNNTSNQHDPAQIARRKGDPYFTFDRNRRQCTIG